MAIYKGGIKYSLNPKISTGITPAGTINIITNGIYNVSNFASANVNINTINNTDITIKPSTTQQILEPYDNYTGFNRITVSAVDSTIDENITANNIKQGTSILGIEGNLIELNGQTKNITTNGTFYPDNDFNGFTAITVDVNSVKNTDLNVTPLTISQNFTPPESYTGFDNVTIEAVNKNIDSNIKPENIKQGITILNTEGSVIELNGETRNETLTSKNGNTFVPSLNKNGITSITVLPKNQDKTVNPSTTSQTFTIPNDYSGFGNIVVNPVTYTIDENINADNIKKGKTILGVAGNLIELKGQSKVINSNGIFVPEDGFNGFTSVEVDIDTVKNQNKTITQNGSYSADTGYTGLGTVTVNVNSVNNKTLTVTPTISEQNFSVTAPYTGYNNITVNAVTSNIDSNIKASNIKLGSSILGVQGEVVELSGETKNVSLTSSSGDTFIPSSGKNGITSITVTPTNQNKTIIPTKSDQSISIPTGYSGFGTLTVNAVTSSIDNNIIASNIKKGITILNVTGTLESSSGNTNGLLNTIETANNVLGVDISSLLNYNYILKTDGSIELITNGTDTLAKNATNIGTSPNFTSAYENDTTVSLINLSQITSISINSTSDYGGMLNMFYNSTNVKNVIFSNLTNLGGGDGNNGYHPLKYAFKNTAIEEITFNSLSELRCWKGGSLKYACAGMSKLKRLFFPALNSNSFHANGGTYINTTYEIRTNQLDYMLYECSNVTVHFPNNLETLIGSWSSVLAGFSGTNTTILFDLPATS